MRAASNDRGCTICKTGFAAPTPFTDGALVKSCVSVKVSPALRHSHPQQPLPTHRTTAAALSAKQASLSSLASRRLSDTLTPSGDGFASVASTPYGSVNSPSEEDTSESSAGSPCATRRARRSLSSTASACRISSECPPIPAASMIALASTFASSAEAFPTCAPAAFR